MNALRAARVATFTYFALNGFLLGMWIVHIPTVERRVGIDHAELGRLLLVLGLGAFIGMRIGGWLTDRFGARVITPLAGVVCSAAVVLPGLATGEWALAAALLAFGFGNGVLDMAMNGHAVVVEREYARPVMSAFHATWSLGGVAASLVGARTLSWELSPATTLGVAAVVGVVISLVTAPALSHGATTIPHEGDDQPKARRKVPVRIWVMAGLAFMVMLSEGVANDWSVLHLQDVLDAEPQIAALAYGAFATTMTAGRLLADRVAAKIGPMAVLRWGAVIAAAGLLLAAFSPWTGLAIVGWAVAGAGLSGTVPQLFSAAGHTDPSSAAVNMSRVAGLGYIGVLAGPAVIGWLTHLVPLNVAFVLPVVFCVVTAFAAGVLKPVPADTERTADPVH
ncbi:MFS transporter [Nocardia sp. NRRL S-836]|uniref:MFS transporter n=1 Tax=Nocardia sp. NRRL S-836 TaxID=1519492 RepID=UPI0006AD91ED|nr:MFS transporter [Nocardia sp. NRRL S-836]